MAHAKRYGNALRRTFAKEGKALKRKAGGYAHAKQFNLETAVDRFSIAPPFDRLVFFVLPRFTHLV